MDLPALTKASYLCRMGDWAVIDVETSQGRMRGFVPMDAITLDAIDLNQNPNFADTAALLERAGIAATPRGIKDNTIYFDLQNGGIFWYYYYENLEAKRMMDLNNPVPTVLAEVDFSAQKASGKYVCSICGYVYDPAEHDGVAFEDLPDDWRCPRCKQPKEKFNKA